MISANFDAPHYYELLLMAYKNGNIEEMYRYSTAIIENEPSYKKSEVWAYKGYAAGMLSTPVKPRIQEMKNSFEKAREFDIDVDWIGEKASYVVLMFLKEILDIFKNNQDIYASEKRTTTVLLPQKSVSASLGAGLGAGIANGMIESSNRKDAAKKNGEIFRKKFEPIIMDGLNYAWSISSSEKVEDRIEIAFSLIILATGLDKKSKEAIINNSASELISEVKQKYPEFKLPDMPGDGCCFIATAVIGDHNHPDVIVLKQFRDIILQKSKTGRFFIALYYRVSPHLSRIIESKLNLRVFLYHYLIKPIVYYASWKLSKKIKIPSIQHII